MEDKIELAPALERVTTSIAETQRRRLGIEAELTAAAAVIESLRTRSSSLEQSVHDVQRELDATLKAQTQETQALAELGKQRQRSADELAALVASIGSFVEQKESSAASMSTRLESAQADLDAVDAKVQNAQAAAEAVSREVSALRERINARRTAAEAAVRQLDDIAQGAQSLGGTLSELNDSVKVIRTSVGEAQQRKDGVTAASRDLQTLAAQLREQQSQAQQAAKQLADLAKQREGEASDLSARLSAMGAVVKPQPAITPELTRQSEPSLAREAAGQPADEAVRAVASAAPRSKASEAAASAPVGPIPPAPQPAPTVGRQSPAGSKPVPLPRTAQTVKLLCSQQYILDAERATILDMLDANDADKFVRPLWLRAKNGNTPAVYYLIIGDALTESGDVKMGMSFYNQAISARNADPFIIYLVALALMALDRHDEALRLGKTLSRDKNGKLLARNLESIHLQHLGKLAEAQAKLTEALSMPAQWRLERYETLYNMGRLQELKGDAAAAVDSYEKLRAANAAYRDVGQHIQDLQFQSRVGSGAQKQA
ncbi:MAG: hypothetical protein DLM53_07555 [Candidatus Eremiobacter antarcticus]|nr:hypothetical protein [Candidatus Eremiobacteraeota bacterium]MBC5807230.1 hypothetical protein [Candidatus Eremiobacteraeota bacterium]PZR61911.1 MAG: hypothetical protein DLM53_07555 [Candidatus Eremiobacter sp. RRmetagenome_bin22]